ncbi:hypothetical protein Q8W71_07730 [Methylobacterium sp. NEAU 140]|uniref:hypothetical protein n=1 Tax=Methylobacterium sp. NEAU 140 TaxID=3064945 RepID=UPI0027376D88|nr:hypothetical protein [Methylobacterium sp. NEAU 140]MDP4022508.1 hypothetical protein [Methylobacterium sp. NEAU 140]
MSVLNADHLFDQARRLVEAPPAGPPRQVDSRHAISAAYYGVFHAVLTAAADAFVGSTKRTSARYALVYRSVDHRALRDLCTEAQRLKPSPKYLPYLSGTGFGPNLRSFASAVLELQEKRHRADYDPRPHVRTSDALIAVQIGETAIRRFRAEGSEGRTLFLTLLLFPPR